MSVEAIVERRVGEWTIRYPDGDYDKLSVKVDTGSKYFSDKICIQWNGNDDNRCWVEPQDVAWLIERLQAACAILSEHKPKEQPNG